MRTEAILVGQHKPVQLSKVTHLRKVGWSVEFWRDGTRLGHPPLPLELSDAVSLYFPHRPYYYQEFGGSRPNELRFWA